MIFFIIQRVIIWILRAYLLLLLIRAVMTWVRVMPGNRFVYFLTRVTEPVLMFFRTILRRTGLANSVPFDLSYIFAGLAIGLLINIVYYLGYYIGYYIG